MRRDFAVAITPVLNAALNWIERITDQSRPAMEKSDVIDAQANLKKTIERAQPLIETRDRVGWPLVLYAIVAWIDEQSLSHSWEGTEWWKNHTLEQAYFGTKDGHDIYYAKAEEAISKNNRNAIEIYFLCVVLGFRGMYMDVRSRDADLVNRAKTFIHNHSLPGDLREWLQRIAKLIPLGKSSVSSEIIFREGEGAPPLGSKSSFVSSLLFCLIAVGCLAMWAWFSFQN